MTGQPSIIIQTNDRRLVKIWTRVGVYQLVWEEKKTDALGVSYWSTIESRLFNTYERANWATHEQYTDALLTALEVKPPEDF